MAKTELVSAPVQAEAESMATAPPMAAVAKAERVPAGRMPGMAAMVA